MEAERSEGVSLPRDVDQPGLLDFYKEHVTSSRHFETQRSTIATIALALAGAIVARLGSQRLNRSQLPFTLLLILLGAIAGLLSDKLYERFRLDRDTAIAALKLLNPRLDQLRNDQKTNNKKSFPLLYRLRLFMIWRVFFLLIIALGCALTFVAAQNS